MKSGSFFQKIDLRETAAEDIEDVQLVDPITQAPTRGRRRVPRRPIELPVGLLAKGQYHVVMSYEIGEGGMLIDSATELTKNQQVVITVRIPGVLSGVALGKVVYILKSKDNSMPVRYGIQFEKIDFDVKRKIRNYVASNTTTANAA